MTFSFSNCNAYLKVSMCIIAIFMFYQEAETWLKTSEISSRKRQKKMNMKDVDASLLILIQLMSIYFD